MIDFEEVLSTPMETNDAEAFTIGEYLKELLMTLWIEGEGFSGKRPFGNSGWEYELYAPLVRDGWVVGVFEDGYLEEVDEAEANRLIKQCIEYIFENYVGEYK